MPYHPYKRHTDSDLPHNWLCCNRRRWLYVCNHYQPDCKHIHLGIRKWTNGRTHQRTSRIANNLLDLYGNVTSVLDYWISIFRKVYVCVWHKQHSRISSTNGGMAKIKRNNTNIYLENILRPCIGFQLCMICRFRQFHWYKRPSHNTVDLDTPEHTSALQSVHLHRHKSI